MSQDFFEIFVLVLDAPWDLENAIYFCSKQPPFGLCTGGNGSKNLLIDAGYAGLGFGHAKEGASGLLAIAHLHGLLAGATHLVISHGSRADLTWSLRSMGMRVLFSPEGRIQGLLPPSDFTLRRHGGSEQLLYTGKLDDELLLLSMCALYQEAVSEAQVLVEQAVYAWDLGSTGDGRHEPRGLSRFASHLPFETLGKKLLGTEQLALVRRFDKALLKSPPSLIDVLGYCISPDVQETCPGYSDIEELLSLIKWLGELWLAAVRRLVAQGQTGTAWDEAWQKAMGLAAARGDARPTEYELLSAAEDVFGITDAAGAYRAGVPMGDISS